MSGEKAPVAGISEYAVKTRLLCSISVVIVYISPSTVIVPCEQNITDSPCQPDFTSLTVTDCVSGLLRFLNKVVAVWAISRIRASLPGSPSFPSEPPCITTGGLFTVSSLTTVVLKGE